LLGTIAQIVDGARHQFLACSALAHNQHGRAEARHAPHQIVNYLRAAARSNQLIAVARSLRPPHLREFLFQHCALMRPAYDDLELRQGRRLANAVIGAAQKKLGCGGSSQIIRHHHDRNTGIRHLTEKRNLLFECRVVEVEIQNQDLGASLRGDLFDPVLIGFQFQVKQRLQRGRQQWQQLHILRVQDQLSHRDRSLQVLTLYSSLRNRRNVFSTNWFGVAGGSVRCRSVLIVRKI
jgi:hypothetical protein